MPRAASQTCLGSGEFAKVPGQEVNTVSRRPACNAFSKVPSRDPFNKASRACRHRSLPTPWHAVAMRKLSLHSKLLKLVLFHAPSTGRERLPSDCSPPEASCRTSLGKGKRRAKVLPKTLPSELHEILRFPRPTFFQRLLQVAVDGSTQQGVASLAASLSPCKKL